MPSALLELEKLLLTIEALATGRLVIDYASGPETYFEAIASQARTGEKLLVKVGEAVLMAKDRAAGL